MRKSTLKRHRKQVEIAESYIKNGDTARATRVYDRLADSLSSKARKKKRRGPSVKSITTHFESNRRKH